MTTGPNASRLSTLFVVCAFAFAGCASQRQAPAAGSPSPAQPCPSPATHERLNAVLWMQTSAEYQAIVETTFRQAGKRVAELAKAPPATLRSAALEQSGRNTRNLKLAVIVDVDETILDNSPMNGALMHNPTQFSCLWNSWVAQYRADFLAGAECFVGRAEAAGVDVFFVTNRNSDAEAYTIQDLRPLVVTPDRILTVGEEDPHATDRAEKIWTKEKSARRSAIARSHWIIALVGDDLADFLPSVREKVTPEKRVQAMRDNLDRFGDQWFLLPNPAYGSWEEAVTAGASGEQAKLAAKWHELRVMPGADGCPCPSPTP